MVMVEGFMEMASASGDLTAKLTDDILSDIISRMPYKSTCCCKYVSTRWRDLISHPYHRKKMPQSLTGFFHESFNRYRSPRSPKFACCFTNVSGIGEPLVDPLLSFLPKFVMLGIVDCCNGLLLCSFWKQNDPVECDYVVCNPATEKWVVVPGTKWSSKVDVRLAFDPAVSSHFHVCEFIEDRFWSNEDHIESKYCIAAVVIYSSKTGVWSHKADAWIGDEIETTRFAQIALFRGVLYLCGFNHKLVALDVEGNIWKVMPLPP
uniref:Uncharacterized protein n=1 Tax=Avena sativa TaxID=4498 RepID=A0ACD5XIV2_AVESA